MLGSSPIAAPVPRQQQHKQQVRHRRPAQKRSLAFTPQNPQRVHRPGAPHHRLGRSQQRKQPRRANQQSRHPAQRPGRYPRALPNQNPRRQRSKRHRARLVKAARRLPRALRMQRPQHAPATRHHQLRHAPAQQNQPQRPRRCQAPRPKRKQHQHRRAQRAQQQPGPPFQQKIRQRAIQKVERSRQRQQRKPMRRHIDLHPLLRQQVSQHPTLDHPVRHHRRGRHQQPEDPRPVSLTQTQVLGKLLRHPPKLLIVPVWLY